MRSRDIHSVTLSIQKCDVISFIGLVRQMSDSKAGSTDELRREARYANSRISRKRMMVVMVKNILSTTVEILFQVILLERVSSDDVFTSYLLFKSHSSVLVSFASLVLSSSTSRTRFGMLEGLHGESLSSLVFD